MERQIEIWTIRVGWLRSDSAAASCPLHRTPSRPTRSLSYRRIRVSASRGRFPGFPPCLVHLSEEEAIVPWGGDGSGVVPYLWMQRNHD